MVSEDKMKKLLAKLQSPVSFDYISKKILETDVLTTREVLAYLIEDEIIEETENKFYKVKTK
jgi:hypothetical protein